MLQRTFVTSLPHKSFIFRCILFLFEEFDVYWLNIDIGIKYYLTD